MTEYWGKQRVLSCLLTVAATLGACSGESRQVAELSGDELIDAEIRQMADDFMAHRERAAAERRPPWKAPPTLARP